MRRRATLGILITLLLVGGGMASSQDRKGDSKKAKIQKLFELTRYEESCRMLLQEYLALSHKDAEGVPKSFWASFSKEADTRMVMQLSAQVCDEGFTENDMEGLVEFFESPLGMKIRDKRSAVPFQLFESWRFWAHRQAIEADARLQEEGHVPEPPDFTDAELEAIASLRTLTRAQAVFREGDKDKDGVLAFAPNLPKLKMSGLIDDDLAEGAKGVYTFTLVGGVYDWWCVAMPADVPTDLHAFIICADGEVRFAPKGIIPGCTAQIVHDTAGRKGRRGF